MSCNCLMADGARKVLTPTVDPRACIYEAMKAEHLHLGWSEGSHTACSQAAWQYTVISKLVRSEGRLR